MDQEYLPEEYGPKWSDQRAERMLGALVCAVVGLLLALIVTVFVRAWPSFAHNGLAWFGPAATSTTRSTRSTSPAWAATTSSTRSTPGS